MDEKEVLAWIRVQSFDNGYYRVHEIRCPKCRHTETYIGWMPDRCYICDERRT